MNMINPLTSSNVRDGIAAVRAIIEREFSPLRKQQPRVFQLALNEAEALAWQTGFAHLLFPALALEKVRAVAEWHTRQESIRQGEPILSFAA
jgi:hypothetical protein